MALYNDKVMEYFMNPHNVGEIENPDGKGTYGSPVCGDMMQITISVDDNDVITDAKFKTFGCGSAIASSSMATSCCQDSLLCSGRACHQGCDL